MPRALGQTGMMSSFGALRNPVALTHWYSDTSSFSQVALFGPHQRSFFGSHEMCGPFLLLAYFSVSCIVSHGGRRCLHMSDASHTRMESKGGSWFVWCLILPRLHQLGSRHPKILFVPALGDECNDRHLRFSATCSFAPSGAFPSGLARNVRAFSITCIFIIVWYTTCG